MLLSSNRDTNRATLRRRIIASAAALAVGALLSASASAQESVWTGAADDNWFNPANWTNGVPNGATFDAVVGAPAPANMTGFITIFSLDVLAGGVVNVGNSSNFNFNVAGSVINAGQVNIGIFTDFQLLNTVVNSGDFFIDGTSSTSDFELITDTTLTGGGTFTLGGTNARFSDNNGAALRLTNADNTIQGIGQIGANTIDLTNAALIDANAGGTLTIDTAGTSFNTGTMRATSGTLNILNSTFDNTGGTIASAGGQVLLNNASITGGTITGGDVFVPNSVNTDFADLLTDAAIQVGINTDLGVNGTITNDGTVTVNGSSSTSNIELQSNTLFAGSGSIFLDGGNARISDVVGAALVFTNGANHTVRGNGQVGANAIDVVNNGVITADVNGGTMTIDPAVAFTNNAILRAENGGTLQLDAGNYLNNGTIASAGGQVRLNNASITGGTLTGADFFVTNSSNTEFFDLTSDANIQVGIFTDLGVNGTIANNGLITVDGSSSTSDIELQTDTTFNGTGAILLDGGNARISDSVGAALLLTNGANHTVRGNGQVGAHTIDVLNNGLITADVSGGTMTIDPAVTFTNNDTIQAENGGILNLAGGAYANGGGTILALAGSTVSIDNGAQITGGTLGGPGGFVVPNSVNAGLTNLTNNAAIGVGASTDLEVTGTITNNGTVTVNGSSSTSDIELQSNTLFAGSGSIFLDGGNARISDVGGAALVFTNGVNHTVRGNGQTGSSTIDFVNNGRVDADIAAGTMTLDPASASGGLVNSPTGTLAASNGGTLQLIVGDFANEGTVATGANSLVNFNGGLTNSPSAAMTGNGTIAASGLITNGGLIAPGTSAGELTLDSDVDLLATSLLSIEVGGLLQGDEYDHLIVTADLLLDGELSLSLLNGFTPDAADTFTVTSAAFLDGAFDNVANGGVLLTDDGFGSFVVNYGSGSAFDPNQIVLSEFILIPEPGSLSLVILPAALLLRRRRAA